MTTNNQNELSGLSAIAADEKSSVSRRSLMGLLGAGAAAVVARPALGASRAILPFEPARCDFDNGYTLWEIANAVRMSVPRKDGFKWGWGIDVFQTCPGHYMIRGRSEEHEGSTTGQAASLPFYTTMRLNAGAAYPNTDFGGGVAPQVLWTRDDCNKLVKSPSDVDFMKLYLKQQQQVALNNLEASAEGVDALKATSLDKSLDAAIASDRLFKLFSGSTKSCKEFAQMSRWLQTSSDPWSVTTWREINAGSNGSGLYLIAVYHRFDNAADDMKRVLAATFDYGTGLLKRIDSASDLNGSFPAEIFAGPRMSDGRVSRNYKVGNMNWHPAESTLYVPSLEQEYANDACPKC